MSESATATYEWNQLPWRKLEGAVFKLDRIGKCIFRLS